jgi:hypothetical protein
MAQDVVAQWMEAYRKGELNAAIDAHLDQISSQHATEARAVYDEAVSQQPMNAPMAMAALAVAAAVSERLGQQYDQIRNLIDFLQILFMQANTPDDYKSVRESIFPLQGYADKCKAFDLAFELQVNAADCSFFAFTANDFELAWLKTALADLLAACKRAPGFQSDFNFGRMVDLIANTAKRAITRVMPDADRAQVDLMLRSLAAETNILVPVDFQYRNDAEQTSRIVYWLDQLNQNYGQS